jgi:DNA polymerase
MTTAERLRKLEQMGLGPVWVRRGHAVAGAEYAEAAEGAGHAEHASTSDVEADTRGTHAAAVGSLQQSAVGMPARAREQGSSATASDAEIAAMDWDALEASILSCTRCRLCEGRKLAVPGTGDRKARWLFVGEGPGRTEDQQGEPFVGPAGKLLDNMLRALGLARGEATYIANVVKCRPVGPDGRDRPPSADESAACRPYLERQIALIQPDIIVALGKVSSLSLLGLPEDSSLSSVRGKPASYAGRPLMPTFHPAYLLRKPADKALAWRDLCAAKRIVDGQ